MIDNEHLDVHAVRRWMKKNNIRNLCFEDFGESTKFTVSYHDGKTSKEIKQ